MPLQRISQPVFVLVPDAADPSYGIPDIGSGRPDNELPGAPGYIWGTLIRWLSRPQIDGGPAKPPGLRPVLPPSIDNGLPPNEGKPPHPWVPGHWDPVDPGFGKPPQWGWFPHIDNGLPAAPALPGNELPGEGGAWVPTDPDFGKPIRPCPPVGGKPHPPLWGWIPDRPDFEAPAQPK